MLDIQYIRENHKKVKQAASNKNISVDIDELLTLDQKRRELLQEIEKLRKARNETAAQMKNGIPAPELIAEGRRIKQTLTELETVLGPIDDSFMELLKQVPNMPLDYVPVGATEDDNVVEKTVGGKPQFDFKRHGDGIDDPSIAWNLWWIKTIELRGGDYKDRDG